MQKRPEQERQKRVLFVSQYFPPEMGAPAARTFELCRHWATRAQITVLTAFPHHPTGIVPPRYRGYLKMGEQVEGINVVRTYVYATPNKGLFRRMASYLSFMVSSIILGPFLTPKVDVIIATSPQFLCALSGIILSWIKRVPFVMEVRDLWPDSIIAVGALSRKNILIRALYFLEKNAYRSASKIVIVSEGFRSELHKKGVPDHKIHCIPNGVDARLFGPRPRNRDLAKALGIDGHFIVSYIGTHGMAHALESLIETASLFQKEGEPIRFLFVGEGARKEYIKTLAKERGLTNCVFVDKVDREKIADYYSITDVCLVVLRKDPLFKTVLPSKLFEAMGMGKPIILAVEGTAKLLLEESKAGIAVEPENPTGLKRGIERFYRDQVYRVDAGEKGYRFVSLHYDREKLALKYLALL